MLILSFTLIQRIFWQKRIKCYILYSISQMNQKIYNIIIRKHWTETHLSEHTLRKFLLNIIKNSVNCQLNIYQLYISTVQQFYQSVHSFEVYLSNFKTQILLMKKVYVVINFFTRRFINCINKLSRFVYNLR